MNKQILLKYLKNIPLTGPGFPSLALDLLHHMVRVNHLGHFDLAAPQQQQFLDKLAVFKNAILGGEEHRAVVAQAFLEENVLRVQVGQLQWDNLAGKHLEGARHQRRTCSHACGILARTLD